MRTCHQITVTLKSEDKWTNYYMIDYYNTALQYRMNKTFNIDKRFTQVEEIRERLNFYADNKVDFSNTNIIIKER
jgi:hypothetical protein